VSERKRTTLHVNGRDVDVACSDSDVLLDTLRNELGLHSVRGTCAIGMCGTCTVLVDGRAVSSCLSLTALNEGRAIVTSEGLGDGSGLDEVQKEFVAHSAFQCSYCIPGIVLAVRAYLDETQDPTVEGAREALSGNLCRCGTYPQILEAVVALIGQPENT
jgi:aerobic-type carbon monoxide dehydrogenase small subunit (CoxS/CutS family)